MRKLIIICAVIMLAAVTSVPAQTAQEIAKAVYDLPDGNTSSHVAVLTLIDKAGKSRVREIAQYNMKDGTTKKCVTVFRSPKDVAGVSYLSFDYPDNPDGSLKDSDSWLYLPAMKKVRRVSGSSKDDDFQGTDFTYDDKNLTTPVRLKYPMLESKYNSTNYSEALKRMGGDDDWHHRLWWDTKDINVK